MRVLHVIEGLSPALGGLSYSVMNLSEALQELGVDGSIITTMKTGNGGLLRPKGVEVYAFERTILSSWRYAPRLSHAVEAEVRRADLVHLHGLWSYPQYVTSRAAICAGKPYLVCPQGMLDAWALRQNRLKKRVYFRLVESRTLSGASSIHAVSTSEVDDVKRLGMTNEVVRIPNGINKAEFALLPDRSAFREKYPMLAGKTILLFLGRLHPKKGTMLLARAFGEAAALQPDLTLVVAGPDSGGCQNQMEDFMDGNGSGGRYLFTGLLGRAERLEALAAADVFVLPSYSEGLPIAVIEALAAGLPAIVTKACNLPSVQENGAGIIVEQDAGSLSAAILKLAGNPVLRREMGLKGRELVWANYTWDEIAARMISVYEGILSKRKAASA